MAELDYNFDMFEEGTAAPKVMPVPKKQPSKKLHIVEETHEVKRERVRIQQRLNTLSTFAIIAVQKSFTEVGFL